MQELRNNAGLKLEKLMLSSCFIIAKHMAVEAFLKNISQKVLGRISRNFGIEYLKFQKLFVLKNSQVILIFFKNNFEIYIQF